MNIQHATLQYKVQYLVLLTLAFFFQHSLFAEDFIISSIDGKAYVCEGEVTTYTYPYTAGNTYNWLANGGTGFSAIDYANNLATFTVEWGQMGNSSNGVSVQEFSNGILINAETYNVVIGTTPEPLITSNFSSDCVDNSKRPPTRDTTKIKCDVVCEYTDVTYSTDFNMGSQYEWTVVGNYSSVSGGNTNSAVVSWTGPGQAYVIVKETNVYGCEGYDTVCIEIVERPKAGFLVDQGTLTHSSSSSVFAPVIEICKGETVCFEDLSHGASSWFWDFGNGNASTDQNPCNVFDQPGGYLVTQIVENDCHCRDTSYLWVKVREEIGPEIVCNNVVCGKGVFSYDAILPTTSCSQAHYNWTISNNGIIVGSNGTVNNQTSTSISGINITTIDVEWGSGPNGTISLSITGCDDVCNAITTIDVPIIPPSIDIEGDSIICLFNTGNYKVPCYPGAVYEWTVNGVQQGSTTSELEYHFDNIGDYTITVSYDNKFLSCQGVSKEFNVRVLGEFNVSGDKAICENSTATFTAQGPASLNWQVINQNNVVVDNATSTSSFTTISTLDPGVYSVIATDASTPRAFCNYQKTLLLEVVASPSTPTAINGPLEVCVGEAAVYTAEATSSSYFLEWEINNNGTITTTNGNMASVIWGSGTKSVSLYQISKATNCRSAAYTINVTDKTAPTVVITGPTPVCGNTDASSPVIYQTSAVLDGYEWSISPVTAGSVISGQNTNSASVIWNNYNGNANVVLTPIVCSNSMQAVNYTVNITTPEMTLSGPTVVCQGASSSWSGSFDFGTASAYSWEIESTTSSTIIASGNGSTINYSFPNHSGSFVVRMSATNCLQQFTVTKSIFVNPKPVANLTFSGQVDCIDQESAELILSTQSPNPYTYTWYKNGNALVPQPSGTSLSIGNNASDAGSYWVEIVDGNGCSSITNTIQATICQGNNNDSCISNNATASFTYNIATSSPTPGCNKVTLTETISPTPTSISWLYNGNVVATGSNPTISAPASGVYMVYMVASYGQGICTVADSQTIVVPVIADFEVDIYCSTNGLQVNLINTSDVVIHPLNTFNHQWNIYDANNSIVATSSSLDFTNVPGLTAGETYQLSLTETKSYSYLGQNINASCTHTMSFTMPEVASADFSMSDLVICEGNTVEFTDQSAGDIASWYWDFGDYSSILTQNPTKTYNENPQLYDVKLRVTDEYGCVDSTIKQIDVKKNNIDGNISVNPATPICPSASATLTFNNTTTPSSAPYSYLWTNNSTTSSITVQQTSTHYIAVTDLYGCFKSFGPKSVEVVDMPTPIISGNENYCNGDEVHLAAYYGDNYDYQWYIKYPSTTSFVPAYSTTSTFIISYVWTGTYEVKVELSDPINNCTKESSVYTFEVHDKPAMPVLATNPTPACPNNPVTLMVTNPQDYQFISWSTGDVGISATALSSGIYTAIGTDNNGCQSSSQTIVHELPDFCGFMCGCYSECIAFGDTFHFPGIEGFYAEWRWEKRVGNSWVVVSSGTGEIEDYIVTTQSSETIRLYVKTINGCEDYSCEVDLDITLCMDDCKGRAIMKQIDCASRGEDDAMYRFSSLIYFEPFGEQCKEFIVDFVPPFGEVNIHQSTTVHPGENEFTGNWFTNQPFVEGGEYCFDVIITNKCDMSSCKMTFCFKVPPCGDRKPNAIEKYAQKAKFISIYPNPSDGNIIIKSSIAKEHTVKVFSTEGKLVFDKQLSFSHSNQYELELSHLSKGIYYIQCITEDAMETKKIIIQ